MAIDPDIKQILAKSALITPVLLSDMGIDTTLVIDASWHMPASGRNARAEYDSAHIPGAVFFDLDAVSEQHTSLPHMLPSTGRFAEAMRALGVSDDTNVVVYDSAGMFSAARLWWMLRVFGHDKVWVLDGGLPAWKVRYEEEVTHGVDAYQHPLGSFMAMRREWLVASREKVAQGMAQVCDARSPARFSGKEKDPRPGVRSGHIPGSYNVHYASLLTEQGRFRPREELRQVFEAAGAVPSEPLITSCGSGVTACILALALYELGYPDVAVYDGSWAEWGAEANAASCPVAKSA